MGDLAADDGALTMEKPARTREERVAVVGSRPAGLTAARDLVLQGNGGTVLEALGS